MTFLSPPFFPEYEEEKARVAFDWSWNVSRLGSICGPDFTIKLMQRNNSKRVFRFNDCKNVMSYLHTLIKWVIDDTTWFAFHKIIEKLSYFSVVQYVNILVYVYFWNWGLKWGRELTEGLIKILLVMRFTPSFLNLSNKAKIQHTGQIIMFYAKHGIRFLWHFPLESKENIGLDGKFFPELQA